MTQYIFGFAGKMGSGKGTATDLTRLWYPGVPSYRFSDSLREFFTWLRTDFVTGGTAIFSEEQASTPQLQQLSTMLRRTFGEDTLARAILTRVAGAGVEHPLIVVEGIRRVVDIEALRKDKSVQFRLIYIDATPEVRYRRHVVRNEKPGDAELSLGEFIHLGNSEAEEQIESLRPIADVVIENNGAFEDFESSLRFALNKFFK